jgi:TIR domain
LPWGDSFGAVIVSRIFLSHSSTNNPEAVALRDWLAANGWEDEIFLDLDPRRGIAAGERWERALNEAANRCEAVLFLVSKAWLASVWCRKELNLAHHLNKRLFAVLIEDLPVGELPEDLAGTWQIVRLAAGRDHVMLRVVLPITHEEAHVTFSVEGLQRLKHGLEEAGLDAKYFAWPPQSDPNRPPYRGLRPFEAEDAGIFFGRDGPIVEALDRLRGLRETTPPRLLVILGASGAGKSSFLRAGLFPRLARDDWNFLPLPIIRPERAAISGDAGPRSCA